MSLMPKISHKPLAIDWDYLNGMINTDMLLQTFSSHKILKKTFTDLNILKKESLKFFSVRNQIVKNNNAIISIIGPLSQRSDFWSWWFGGTSYEEIRENFRTAVDNNDVKTIIFEIDSPGGEVAGVFDLIDEIKSARERKEIIAVINERAYSAAYGIASAANKRYIPRTGGSGSIGVIAVHTDQSKFDEKIGVKYTPVFAGDRKNDFSPHEPLSGPAYRVIKSEVDDINDLFINIVSENIGVDAQIIRDMQAGIYQGQKAVDVGLADEIKTMTEVLNTGGKRMSKSLKVAISETIKDAKPDELAKAMDAIGYVEKEGMMSEADHAKAMESKGTEFDTKLAENTAVAKAEGKEEAKTEAVSILELCSIAGMEKLGLKMIFDGISKEEAKKQIFAAKTPNQNINSTVNPTHTEEKNLLIADAERRAKEARA